ncbi:MAG: LysM peptidoglycan-binding domain-containing protein [Anaerolineae bacterium]|nr:LysM peptidoglycan-binding domain-containing protein [Anaerolineae bacterium]
MPTPCFVREDWPVTSVATGETLAAVAARVGSTAADLARANCLPGVSMLAAGLTLHVPPDSQEETAINQLWVEPETVLVGDTATFYWSVSGAVGVSIWRVDGKGDRLEPAIAAMHPPSSHFVYEVPESAVGLTTFVLVALDASGAELLTESLTLTVLPLESPALLDAADEPDAEVLAETGCPGETVTLTWALPAADHVALYHLEGGALVLPPFVTDLPATGSLPYTLGADDLGVTSFYLSLLDADGVPVDARRISAPACRTLPEDMTLLTVPEEACPGEPVRLTWSAPGAAEVSVWQVASPGVLVEPALAAGLEAAGTVEIVLPEDEQGRTRLFLRAAAEDGSLLASGALDVTCDRVPPFAIDPEDACPGEPFEFVWDVPGAASVTLYELDPLGTLIVPPVAEGLSAVGSLPSVMPDLAEGESVSYTLSAHDAAGMPVASYPLTLEPCGTADGEFMTVFEAEPAAACPGDVVTFSWEITTASTVTLYQVDALGTLLVPPLAAGLPPLGEFVLPVSADVKDPALTFHLSLRDTSGIPFDALEITLPVACLTPTPDF